MAVNEGWSLQTAIFDRLSTNLDVPVFDFVPEGTPFPYIVLGSEDTRETDNFTTTLTERDINVTVFSDAAGKRQVRAIMADIHDALHRVNFVLDEGRLVQLYVRRQSIAQDLDGKGYLGNVTLRALTAQ